MLVLSRKVGEQIVIGRGVTVAVLAVNGQRVRLGVVAPDDVSIHRAEVFHRIPHENEQPVAQPSATSPAFDVFA